MILIMASLTLGLSTIPITSSADDHSILVALFAMHISIYGNGNLVGFVR